RPPGKAQLNGQLARGLFAERRIERGLAMRRPAKGHVLRPPHSTRFSSYSPSRIGWYFCVQNLRFTLSVGVSSPVSWVKSWSINAKRLSVLYGGWLALNASTACCTA